MQIRHSTLQAATVVVLIALSAVTAGAQQRQTSARALPEAQLTPTLCPVATPEWLRVAPVTSPWFESAQTISVTMNNMQAFTVTSNFGLSAVRVLESDGSSVGGVYTTSMPLLPGANALTVTAKVRLLNQGGCIYGGYTLTQHDLLIDRVCPPVAPLDTTIRVAPIVTSTINYIQVLSVGVTAATSVTATVQGQTRSATFTGSPGGPGFLVPIDLRQAGGSPSATGGYTITVHAHWAARGEPSCGLGAIDESTGIDTNGRPLVVQLEPAVCPAVAGVPPKVYQVESPTNAFTQTIRGERGGLTTRVLVSGNAGVFTATSGVTNTWSATINLSPGITNSIQVYGVDFADTQCEARIGPVEQDINGAPLRIVQLSRARAWLPVMARGGN
jgi:hypothetical protein